MTNSILKGEQNYTRLLLPDPINNYPYKGKRLSIVIRISQEIIIEISLSFQR